MDDTCPPDHLLFDAKVIGGCLDTYFDEAIPRCGASLRYWVSYSSLFKSKPELGRSGNETSCVQWLKIAH